ncbi:CcmD family protein [Flammeovirga yaeyamensis]|uniref:CcmD family protein n=2 Tax=Flammeovirga TaxID=59739 RepID=A0A1S1YZX0_FLAPC|nr:MULTISPECIES: CcmD family protein [Flammeovirga]ANQ49793.1 CcmD family protein [Flammeovirga sp. MY04]MBB3697345.1 CcmD family protein [Flammeovirga yaeyamensis]NMF36039.1 CcmD family protein [Flammeovirga yaeyamensis]OHX66550.1 CcmD family protein [Flammeovirga pacifica]QWG02774.1 CcmD family protein [Flammeovirga yaeyamensis]
MKKFINTILLSIFSLTFVSAQEKIQITEKDYSNFGVEMADALHANGKIYVVVAVVAAIWVGFMVYLFLTDRKITQLEKMINDK